MFSRYLFNYLIILFFFGFFGLITDFLITENRLYAKAEKGDFYVSSASFLGYIIGQGQIRMDPSKVSAVAEWTSPPNRKRLQQFLGFANFYRRFIRGYSQVAAPLTALTSTKSPFS